MARIRTIKPEFFRSETIGCMTPLARLLFIGLWTMADRDGRLLDRPRRISVELFPYDEDFDIAVLLDELTAHGVIRRYETGGKKCIQIDNFAKHQRPHPKEPPSETPPEPSDTNPPSREKTRQAAEEHGETTPCRVDKGNGEKEGKGREPAGAHAIAGTAAPESVADQRPVTIAAMGLSRVFAEERAAVLGGLPWNQGAVDPAKQATRAAVLDESGVTPAAVRASMRRFWESVKAGRHPEAQRCADKSSFAMGSWFDGVQADLERASGVAPVIAAARGSPPRDLLADLEDLTPATPQKARTA